MLGTHPEHANRQTRDYPSKNTRIKARPWRFASCPRSLWKTLCAAQAHPRTCPPARATAPFMSPAAPVSPQPFPTGKEGCKFLIYLCKLPFFHICTGLTTTRRHLKKKPCVWKDNAPAGAGRSWPRPERAERAEDADRYFPRSPCSACTAQCSRVFVNIPAFLTPQEILWRPRLPGGAA